MSEYNRNLSQYQEEQELGITRIIHTYDERDASYMDMMKKIGREYGVHVEIQDTPKGAYLVAWPEKETPIHNPEEIEARAKSHSYLFYPNEFAMKATDTNTAFVAENLIEYCMKTEFLHTIYNEFQAPLPDKLRSQEVYSLIDFNDGRYDPKMPGAVQTDYAVALDKFFKAECRTNFIYRKWLAFYRSDWYNPDKSNFKNILKFLTTNLKKQEVPLNTLIQSNREIKTVEMQEHEYQEFKDYMKECYPEVPFSAGKKTVIDHGQLDIPDNLKGKIYNPWEGEQSHWEFRDIAYKASDEPIIAKVFNKIRLEYANDSSLERIQNRGGHLAMVDMPLIDFDNFASLMHANNVPFHIDDGKFADSNMDIVHVVFNDYNTEMVSAIIARILLDKTEVFHAVYEDQRERASLNQQISDAKKQTKSTTLQKNRDKEYLR